MFDIDLFQAENKLIITQEATIDFFFFKWVYTCTGVPMRNSIYIRDHLIKPLLFMNFELQRELALMKDEIKAKDREIQAYINKGQRIMKGIATPTFVDDEWTTKQLVSVECLVRLLSACYCALLISTSVRYPRTSFRLFSATGPQSEGTESFSYHCVEYVATC